jgi:hypothetical protein
MNINTKEKVVRSYSAILPNGKEITARSENALKEKFNKEIKQIELEAKIDPFIKMLDEFYPNVLLGEELDFDSQHEFCDVMGIPLNLLRILENSIYEISIGYDFEFGRSDDPDSVDGEAYIWFTKYTPKEKIFDEFCKKFANEYSGLDFKDENRKFRIKMSGDNSRNFNKQYIKHNPVEYKMYCEFDKWFKTDFPKKLEETFVLLKTPSEQKKSSKRR